MWRRGSTSDRESQRLQQSSAQKCLITSSPSSEPSHSSLMLGGSRVGGTKLLIKGLGGEVWPPECLAGHLYHFPYSPPCLQGNTSVCSYCLQPFFRAGLVLSPRVALSTFPQEGHFLHLAGGCGGRTGRTLGRALPLWCQHCPRGWPGSWDSGAPAHHPGRSLALETGCAVEMAVLLGGWLQGNAVMPCPVCPQYP